mgnify:CR=1 FL=1
MVNAMQMEKRTRYVLFVAENKGTMGALGIFDMENIKIARIRKLFYKMGMNDVFCHNGATYEDLFEAMEGWIGS